MFNNNVSFSTFNGIKKHEHKNNESTANIETRELLFDEIPAETDLGVKLSKNEKHFHGHHNHGIKGEKFQGALHANEASILNRKTTEEMKIIMAENNIEPTGKYKEDITAIKDVIKDLDADAAEALKAKLKEAGIKPELLDEKDHHKKSFDDFKEVVAGNKKMILNKFEGFSHGMPFLGGLFSTEGAEAFSFDKFFPDGFPAENTENPFKGMPFKAKTSID